MANKVTLTFEIDDKGALKLLSKDADKAAKSLNKTAAAGDKLNKQRNHYNKFEKGAAGATANSTKAFSKMQQTMGGSTGLVQSYAILASNVFAATAAFSALRRSGQVEQLAEGLQFTGNAAGRNLKVLADGLVGVTGAAVSTAAAMRTVAVGVSAGFRSDQMKDLATVAKGASIALGRDMGDALDRLTRGVAKIEPEILDELGILVRLDTASQKYAATLGITVEAMTQFDKQQAFLNATVEQGLKKYEDVANAIDPNVYDQLSASLHNLALEFVKLLDSILYLTPVFKYLSENTTAMAGAVGLALIPITKRLVPGMFSMAHGAAEAAKETANLSREHLGNIKAVGKMPAVYGKLLPKLKDGSLTTEEFGKMQKSLTQSLKAHTVQLENNTSYQDTNSAAYKKKISAMDEIKQKQKQLLIVERDQLKVSAAVNRANAIGYASNLQMGKAFTELNLSAKAYSTSLVTATTRTGTFTKSLNVMKVSAYYAGGAVKVLGAALLRFLPYIGLIITGVTILSGIIRDKWFPPDIVEERLAKAAEVMDNFAKISSQFQDSAAEGGRRVANAYIAYAGVLEDVRDLLGEISELEDRKTASSLAAAEARVLDLDNKIADLSEAPIADTELRTNKHGHTTEVKRNATEMAIAKEARAARIKELRAENVIAHDIAIKAAQNASAATLQIQRETASKTIQLAIDTAQELAIEERRSGREGGIFTAIYKQSGPALTALVRAIDEGKRSIAEILVEFEQIQRGPKNIRDAFQSIGDAVTSFSQQFNKSVQRTKGPFDELLAATDGIEDKFIQIEETAKMDNFKISDSQVLELIKQLETDIEGLNIEKQFGKGRAGLIKFRDRLKGLNSDIFDLTKQAVEFESVSKRIDTLTKGVFSGEGLRIDAANRGYKTRLALREKEAERIRAIIGTEAETLKTAKTYDKLQAAIAGLKDKIVRAGERELKIALSNLEVQKTQNTLAAAAEANAVTLVKLEKIRYNLTTGRAAGLTDADKYEQAVATSQVTLHTAQRSLEYTKAESEIKLQLFAMEISREMLTGRVRKDQGLALIMQYKQQLGITTAIANEKVRAAEAGVAEARIGTLGPPAEAFGLNGGVDAVDSMNTALVHLQGQTKVTAHSFLAASAEAITPFLDQLRELGPDGEVAASMAQGTLVIADSLLTVMDASAKAADRIAAVGNVIASLAAIQKASSSARTAGLDAEIAAEKKRDGNSARSLAIISGLEKKKEKEAKKAFEVNKKMQMASAVISTASAVVGALAWDPKGWWNIPLAAMIGAMGAAQLAVIAGTSYQGGASSASSVPTNVAVGERSSTVDLASSRSPSGELAYMRGATGTGGINEFVPTFTGRATGGNTGLIVGEQGPELFVPEVPGRVLPADEAGNTGGAVSVSFQINAVDAQGVDELLRARRGAIISMIREAANSTGEYFLEDVNIHEDDATR